MQGKTIEYNSTYIGGIGGTCYGLDRPQDIVWRDDFRNQSDWDPPDPSVNNVTRWLRTVDGKEIEARVNNGTQDYTDIYNRDGTYPRTRLWNDDPFWGPACMRMSKELWRLHNLAPNPLNEGKLMEVMVKHYGANFPDAQNYNATVWTYIHVTVVSEGNAVVPAFTNGCMPWFGDLADVASAIRPVSPNWTQWIANGAPVIDKDNKTVMIPPQLLRATAGGVKAVQAQDNSNFTLWVVPNYEFKL